MDVEKAFARAERVRVIEGGVSRGAPLGSVVLATLEGEDLARLHDALRSAPSEPFHCMCLGDHALEVLDGRGRRLLAIGLHHGRSIRVPDEDSDRLLAEPMALLELLARVGAPGPRDAFVADRARADEDEKTTRRWRAAMPDELRAHRLVNDFGLPHPSDDPRWQAALAALGGDAAPKLLRWLSTSESPWSGYPVEVDVALQLLDRVGPAGVAEAVRDVDDPALLRAAGRAFAHFPGSRRELREATVAVAVKVRAVVTDADALARLNAALRPAPRARIDHPNAVLVGTCEHAAPAAIAVHDGVPFAVDGVEVVTFDPTRRVLCTLAGRFAELAVDERRVVVTDMAGARVLVVARDTGAIEMHSEQPRPMRPCLFGGRAAWICAPFQTNAKTGTSVAETRIMVLDDGHLRRVASFAEPPAWDLCALEEGLFLVIREEPWFGSRRVLRLRRVGWDGSIARVRELAKEGDAFVRLHSGYESLFWTGRGDDEVWACMPDGGWARRVGRYEGRLVGATCDARGLVVGTRLGDELALWDCAWSREEASLLIRFPATVDPELAADAYGVIMSLGLELVRVPR